MLGKSDQLVDMYLLIAGSESGFVSARIGKPKETWFLDPVDQGMVKSCQAPLSFGF